MALRCVQSATEPPTAAGGPFSSEVDCVAADCPPVPVSCTKCIGSLASPAYLVTFSGGTDDYAGLNGTWRCDFTGTCTWTQSAPFGMTFKFAGIGAHHDIEVLVPTFGTTIFNLKYVLVFDGAAIDCCLPRTLNYNSGGGGTGTKPTCTIDIIPYGCG